MRTTSKSCWATTTASPPRRSLRSQACAANSAARTKILYAQGSELADGLARDGDRAGIGALHQRWRGPPQPGCKAEYFNTASFNGQVYRAPGKTPAAAAANATPLFTRVDPEINFKWWDGAPRADMDDDNFGVRWTGFLAPKVTGKYQLGGVGMNAFEIYFNGKQLARGNNTHERNYSYETVDLEAGKLYPIRVDFHEVINDADMRLVWSRAGTRSGIAGAGCRAPGGSRGDVPGPFAASGRRGDEGAGGGIPGRRPRGPRPAGRAGGAAAKGGRARQAGGAGAAQRQRAGGELGARSRARAGGRVVSGPGRRHGHRGCPVRRLQPRGPPARHVLPIGRPVAELSTTTA